MEEQASEDAFDRLYDRWATYALERKMKPPSRERWDMTVLFLLMSQDPNRQERYKDVGSGKPESLGADAFKLWEEMPDSTPNKDIRIRTKANLAEYEAEHFGSMRALMELRGLGERYKQIVTDQVAYDQDRRVRAKRAQTSIIVMGCAGIGAILIMMLTVFIIIGLQVLGK